MHRVPVTGGLPVLAHSRAPAVTVSWCPCLLAWAGAPVACSALERQRAPCRDRELAQLCLALAVADRAEPPSVHLRPRSCEWSPLARPSEQPRRGHQEPAFPA